MAPESAPCRTLLFTGCLYLVPYRNRFVAHFRAIRKAGTDAASWGGGKAQGRMAGFLVRCRLQVLRHRCSSRSNLPPVEHMLLPQSACFRRRRVSSAEDEDAIAEAAVRQQLESAARENRLDLLTAAKILFSTPPKPKTFGLDFHLWQLFVACLPSLAVYFVAQYARYEIRRMEKERDDADQLKLQAAMAEQEAKEEADEESVKQSKLTPGINLSATQNKPLKIDRKGDCNVVLHGKDFIAMKARMDAMEEKVRLLEYVRPGISTAAALGTTPNMPKDLKEGSVERLAARAAKLKVAGENLYADKQKPETAGAEQSQKRRLPSTEHDSRSWSGAKVNGA